MSEVSVDSLAITRLYRKLTGQILATLIARLGDFQLAEDALQDAWLEAAKRWPETGIPIKPAAWLFTVSLRRAIDQLRRIGTARGSAKDLEFARQLETEWVDDDQEIPDDRLRLIFTCCHPSLRLEHQVALTLHTLCGLTTDEIAKAFLVPTTTMAQRLVRAKRKIQAAAIPYRVPDADQLAARLDAVRKVIYLTFNEGYAANFGAELIRDELCDEAIRLGRLLEEQISAAENAGLLALMLLHDSRRRARLDANKAYVPLDQQDQSLWRDDQAAEGKSRLLSALALKRPGPYQIQAAISAIHSDAKIDGVIDWVQIAGLYRALRAFDDSPVIELNHAIAVARADSPHQGLILIEALGKALNDYQPFHAARAELLKQTGDIEGARDAFVRAIALTTNNPERCYLENELAKLGNTKPAQRRGEKQ